MGGVRALWLESITESLVAAYVELNSVTPICLKFEHFSPEPKYPLATAQNLSIPQETRLSSPNLDRCSTLHLPT
jgi:hypothetical protein